MPKATVYEDRNFGFGKDDVSSSIPIANWASVNAISKPVRMQIPSHDEFRLCVSALVPEHRIAHRGTRSPRELFFNE